MQAFARLIEGLLFMPSRGGKLRLLENYFRRTPDPERGWALAALAGTLDFPAAKPAAIRALAAERTDPVLFALSYEYVGDLAETVALIWPERPTATQAPPLSEVVEKLRSTPRAAIPQLIEGWLDALTASERLALLKLITGGLRVGVSARLAKTALAQLKPVAVAEVEELWHGLQPPYGDLFAWLAGTAPPPQIDEAATFRPPMLAQPLEAEDRAALNPGAYRAEWKWDGIRVQVAARHGRAGRLFSRSGDEIGGAFPDILAGLAFDAVLDGELLVVVDGEVQPFNVLQQRLNRKRVTAAMLRQAPAWVRLYDALWLDGEDLRPLPFDARRQRLDTWLAVVRPARMDLSPLVPFADFADLDRLRCAPPAAAIEGVMLKRGDSPYLAGRPKGPWFKWKRDPFTADLVLLYAQRGHGRRSGYHSDFTFGAWRDGAKGPELVPVGKAYFGFTDAEMKDLDRFVRAHTIERFGPVCAVEPKLVLEVAFDAAHRSTRHKSGIALRFPRLSRIRWDKPASEADWLEALERLLSPALPAGHVARLA